MGEGRDGTVHGAYVVERYWLGIDLAQLEAELPRLDAAVRAMAEEGIAIAHLGSILMPVDEVVFTLVAADSEADVRELNRRAELRVDRIARAVVVRSTELTTPITRTGT